MRTLLIILGGVALWAMLLGGSRFFGTSTKTALVAFALVWCAIAAANMWIGVTHAGYSIREELPIFLLIFLLPTGVACLLQWKLL
jgi:hypothetical protein